MPAVARPIETGSEPGRQPYRAVRAVRDVAVPPLGADRRLPESRATRPITGVPAPAPTLAATGP